MGITSETPEVKYLPEVTQIEMTEVGISCLFVFKPLFFATVLYCWDSSLTITLSDCKLIIEPLIPYGCLSILGD